MNDILEDYRVISRRIELDYEVRLAGGLSREIWEAYEAEGIGHIPGAETLNTLSFVLATFRHPIRSFHCMMGLYIENKESSEISNVFD